MQDTYNIAQSLAEQAVHAPYQPAVVFPAGRDAKGRAKTVQFSFLQLNQLCDRYAHGLSALGIRQEERVLLLLRPGVELIAVVFALVKMGAVPVIIDPGMGRQAFLHCVADARPQALIGLPVAQALRVLFPKPFATVKHTVAGGNPAWAGPLLHRARIIDATLDSACSDRVDPFPTAQTGVEDEAVIAFTSGSTGIPKGVAYVHGMFKAQLALLRDEIGIRSGEVDLALLYVFALFNPALGVTTIIPDMDPTKSAEINPAYVVEAVQTHGVTNAFGSPTIWKRVAPYCIDHEIRLPSLKRILMAGAPVSPDLIELLHTHVLAPDAEILTPFGATEAMPLTSIRGREILAETAAQTEMGKGMCVGHPLPGITLRVLAIRDTPIPVWDEHLVLPHGEIGEIAVKGPVVTRTYVNRPEQTALAKIREGDEVWHRMGDLGYFDGQGRLWFCGRKAHRVETATGTLFPVLCETIFNPHPGVNRTALVGIGPHGAQHPVLIVEPKPGHMPATLLERQRFTMELLALGAAYPHTHVIEQVLFYPDVFPTDVRHNVKIQREKLATWAASQLGKNGARQQAQPVGKAGSTAPEGVTYTGRGIPGPHGGLISLVVGVVGLVAGVFVSAWLLLQRRKRGTSDRMQNPGSSTKE